MIILSPEEEEIVLQKANQYHILLEKILNWIIMYFTESTNEEKQIQLRKKQKSFVEFYKKRKNQYQYWTLYPKEIREEIKKAWRDGFNTGWVQYQTRKKDSIYNDPHTFTSEITTI